MNTSPSNPTPARVILITGANGGLGQAIAAVFLQESPANVLYLGVHTRKALASAMAASSPNRCFCLELDVREPSNWENVVSAIVSRNSRLDVLVNNAGTTRDSLLATMPLASWKEVLSANLDGAFHGCQAVLPSMISQRSGRIINVASLSALLVPPGQTNYAAAKAGMVALTQSLAKEVARLNITVNAVCPGYIETEGLRHLSEAARATALARIPMRRFGRPEEVAAAIQFLACPQASYITGSVVKVDGGIF